MKQTLTLNFSSVDVWTGPSLGNELTIETAYKNNDDLMFNIYLVL